MIPTATVAALAAVAVLVSLSAFFSSSETAIFSLPEKWFDGQVETGEARALMLGRLRDDPHRLLVTVLVGNKSSTSPSPASSPCSPPDTSNPV